MNKIKQNNNDLKVKDNQNQNKNHPQKASIAEQSFFVQPRSKQPTHTHRYKNIIIRINEKLSVLHNLSAGDLKATLGNVLNTNLATHLIDPKLEKLQNRLNVLRKTVGCKSHDMYGEIKVNLNLNDKTSADFSMDSNLENLCQGLEMLVTVYMDQATIKNAVNNMEKKSSNHLSN